VLVGATVTVANLATNVSRRHTTNQAGVYNATGLLPGSYKVEVSAAGVRFHRISKDTR
jgi:hypothetical protein